MRFSEIDALPMSTCLIDEVFTVAVTVDDPALTEDQNFFNKIEMEDKPGFDYFQGVMDIYKDGLKEERKLELKAMTNGREREAINIDGTSIDLVAGIFQNYLNTDNETEIIKLVNIIDKIEKKEVELNHISYGKKVESVCQDALNYVIGLNRNKSTTKRDKIQKDFDNVETWLRKSRPLKALGFLANITPDGESVTVEEITLLRNFITREINGI